MLLISFIRKGGGGGGAKGIKSVWPKAKKGNSVKKRCFIIKLICSQYKNRLRIIRLVFRGPKSFIYVGVCKTPLHNEIPLVIRPSSLVSRHSSLRHFLTRFSIKIEPFCSPFLNRKHIPHHKQPPTRAPILKRMWSMIGGTPSLLITKESAMLKYPKV